jgi:hypothetical protein
MLDNLLKISERFNSFDTKAELQNIVDENGDILVKLQRVQLSKGIDNTGRPRSDSYRPLTVAYKRMFGKGLGAVVDRVTFYMTGKLYSSLFYSSNGDKYSILSTEHTYNKMIERIKEDKYGLSPESRLEFATFVTIPEFKKVFKSKVI